MKKSILIYSFLIFLLLSPISRAQWSVIDSTQNTSWEAVFFTDANTGYAAGYGSTAYARLKKTTNAGLSWFLLSTPYDTATDAAYRSVFFTDINTGYVSGGRNSPTGNGIVIKTTNGGNSWIPLNTSMYNMLDYVYFVNSSTGYAAGYGTILKTTDAGANWEPKDPGFSSYLFQICFTSAATGYVVGNQGKIRKTTDGGNTWFSQNSGIVASLWGIGFADANTGIISGGSSSNMIPVILRTTDAGANWYQINYSTSPIGLLWRVRFISPSVAYIPGFYGQILKTSDAGASWCYQTNLPLNCSFRDISFTSSSTGYVVGAQGSTAHVMETTTGGSNCIPVAVQPVSNEIPGQFSLYQNYPNPFNPVTTIKLGIPMLSHIRLVIYDVLGKEIAVLINDELKAGEYKADWDATNYPSGVYFYKLASENYLETKRMVLIK